MDFVTSHFGKMKLWPVEHLLNTFSTYLSSKLDSPSPMFWLEENLILSNVLIRVESNFDDKYVEKVFKKCSTSVQLVRVSFFQNVLLQNPYFSMHLLSTVWKVHYSKINSAVADSYCKSIKLWHKSKCGMYWQWSFHSCCESVMVVMNAIGRRREEVVI